MNPQELCKKLCEKLGDNKTKMSSGSISVYVEPSDYRVEITIGGYDLHGLNRHHHIGPFNTWEEASVECQKLINDSKVICDE